eukprot:Gb_08644 [translate_table: standard]
MKDNTTPQERIQIHAGGPYEKEDLHGCRGGLKDDTEGSQGLSSVSPRPQTNAPPFCPSLLSAAACLSPLNLRTIFFFFYWEEEAIAATLEENFFACLKKARTPPPNYWIPKVLESNYS